MSESSTMQEGESHDLSDDADYAASQQQGSTSISQNGSGGRTVMNEADRAQVVYQKDNVTIHPTQYASERISGRLRLIKQGSSLFMTWIPYKATPSGNDLTRQNSNVRSAERDRNLYTIRPVPFTDVRSIRRHTPTLGWQYIIVVLSSGLAFPPLYFYNGGVREFLATLKEHAFLVRSADDANAFLVNDFQDPLQKSLSSLELPRAVSVANSPSTLVPASPSPFAESSGRTDRDSCDGSPSASLYSERSRQKVHDPAHDLSIQVLEKFSLLTKYARETTSQLLREIHGDNYGAFERKNEFQSLPSSVHDGRSNDIVKVPDEAPVASDPLEFDKLALVWGKPRQPPLGPEEWTTFLDSEGRVMDSKALKKRIFYGGIEHELRNEIWKFLLGYHKYDSTYAEREYLASIKKSEYETIKHQWQVHYCI